MAIPSVVHSTFVLERRFAALPARVFEALSDPGKVRRWYAESEGRRAAVFEMDFRVFGCQRTASPMGENTPFPGVILTSDIVFLDIVPDRRVVLAQTMTLGERRISASLITYDILPEQGGSALVFIHQGAFFEESDGPKMREEGWRSLLDRLGAELTR